DPAPLLSAGQRPKINQPEWQLYVLPTYYNPDNFLQPVELIQPLQLIQPITTPITFITHYNPYILSQLITPYPPATINYQTNRDFLNFADLYAEDTQWIINLR